MKLDEVRQLFRDSWFWRLLSIIGKIQVIKSLAVSKFVHLFTKLPTPNEFFLKNWKHSFTPLFGAARKTIINYIKDGGLKMTDIRSFAKALKISWIKQVWDVNYQADWKRLLLCDHLYWEDVWLKKPKIIISLGLPFSGKYFLGECS